MWNKKRDKVGSILTLYVTISLFLISILTMSQLTVNSLGLFQVQNLSSNELKLYPPPPSSYELSTNGYVPITDLYGMGSTFTAKDILTVIGEQDLNLTYDETSKQFEDNYSIEPISGYNIYNLEYNITEIISKTDWYPVENETDGTIVELDLSRIAVAQAFEIKWDYVLFKGSRIFLDQLGNTGINNLDLLVVKADDISGQPNMSYVYTSDIYNPYNMGNPIPISTEENIAYYNFTNVVLEKGTYFIVANLSNPETSAKNFAWHGNMLGVDDGETYYRASSGVWSIASLDLTCIPHLMPSDEYGTAAIFTDPSDISLQDNGMDVLSLNQPIPSTGSHLLTSDTSVEITFNNTYSFSVDEIATSTYQALNSTFGDNSIYWNLTWNVNQADYFPYSSMSRSFLVMTPDDWSTSSACYYNESEILFSEKTAEGFICYFSDNSSAGNLRIELISSNYVQDLVISNEDVPSLNYYLGSWTNNGITAFGHEGSTLEAEVDIYNNVDTGTLNLTLFNPEGIILPLKSSLPANLSYVDTTEYSKAGIVSSAPGEFTSNLIFDPSVYGSDIPGSWTLFVYWNNGTEVGIFAKEINVNFSTLFNISWEEIPDGDQWLTDTDSTILRKNGDPLDFEAIYSAISEPYFNEYGYALVNSTISFTTGWGESGNFTDNSPFYNLTLSTTYTAVTYPLYFTALVDSGESQAVNLNLELFNSYRIEPVQTYVEINSTDDAILSFKLINETDSLEGVIFPDSIDLYINSDLVSEGIYSQSIEGDNVVLSVRMGSYGITEGTANVSVVITKAGFRSGYSNEVVKLDFEVKVFPAGGFELPYYYILIIIGSAVLVLTLTLYLIAMSRSRKQQKIITTVDVSDKAKIVGLLDSVLSMKKMLIIHSETSLPVFELDISPENNIETTLVSGFLSVVAQMGKTIGGSLTGDIRKLEYKNFVVNSVSSSSYTIFLFSTDDIIKEFNAKLFDLIMWFEYTFEIKGETWDGRIEIFEDKRKLIEDKTAETLYLWIYFPVEVITRKKKDVKTIENINLKIAQFILKREQILLSELITKFQDQGLEEVLTTFFTMVNRGFLKRRQFMSFAQS